MLMVRGGRGAGGGEVRLVSSEFGQTSGCVTLNILRVWDEPGRWFDPTVLL